MAQGSPGLLFLRVPNGLVEFRRFRELRFLNLRWLLVVHLLLLDCLLQLLRRGHDSLRATCAVRLAQFACFPADHGTGLGNRVVVLLIVNWAFLGSFVENPFVGFAVALFNRHRGS